MFPEWAYPLSVSAGPGNSPNSALARQLRLAAGYVQSAIGHGRGSAAEIASVVLLPAIEGRIHMPAFPKKRAITAVQEKAPKKLKMFSLFGFLRHRLFWRSSHASLARLRHSWGLSGQWLSDSKLHLVPQPGHLSEALSRVYRTFGSGPHLRNKETKTNITPNLAGQPLMHLQKSPFCLHRYRPMDFFSLPKGAELAMQPRTFTSQFSQEA